MRTEYKYSGNHVNQFVCLTGNNIVCKFGHMNDDWSKSTLGKRLKHARKLRDISQKTLSEMSGVLQQTISNIETDKQTTSTDIAVLADALEVRPRWLHDGSGEMVDGLYVEGDKMKHLFKVAQQLPDYAVDEAIKRVADLAQLLQKAAGEKK